MSTCLSFVFVSVLSLLTACAAEGGREFSASSANEIHTGTSSKADVVSLLGNPLQRNISPNGDETWTYQHVHGEDSNPAQTFVLSAIPGFGPMIALNNAQTQSNMDTVTISFHGDSVVACRTQSLSQSGRLTDATGGSTTIRETSCGDISKRK